MYYPELGIESIESERDLTDYTWRPRRRDVGKETDKTGAVGESEGGR